jgi:hypothetical protein
VERAENRRQAMAQARKQAREKRERERERGGDGGAACHTRAAQRSEVQCSEKCNVVMYWGCVDK